MKKKKFWKLFLCPTIFSTLLFLPFITVISANTDNSKIKNNKNINGYEIDEKIILEEINLKSKDGKIQINYPNSMNNVSFALIKLKSNLNINDLDFNKILTINNEFIKYIKNLYPNLNLELIPFKTSFRIWINSYIPFSKNEIFFLNKIVNDSKVKNLSLIRNVNIENSDSNNNIIATKNKRKYDKNTKIKEESLNKFLKAINIFDYLKSDEFNNYLNKKNLKNENYFKVGIIETTGNLDTEHDIFSDNNIIQHNNFDINDYPNIFNYSTSNETDIHAMTVATILASKYGVAPRSDIYFSSFYNFEGNVKWPTNSKNKKLINSLITQDDLRREIMFIGWFNSIYFILKNNVKVINHSYRLGLVSKISKPLIKYLEDTFYYNHILHIFSSGNYGNIGQFIPDYKLEKNSIVVGNAVLLDNNKWILNKTSQYKIKKENEFTNSPLIVAPGTDYKLFTQNPISGTSFSAPIISGLYSLFLRQEKIINLHSNFVKPILFKSILVTGASQKNNVGEKEFKKNGLELKTGAGMPDFEKMLEIINNNQYFIHNGTGIKDLQDIKSNKKIKMKKGEKIKISLSFNKIPPLKAKNKNYSLDYSEEYRDDYLLDEELGMSHHALTLKKIDKNGNEEVVSYVDDRNSNILILNYQNNDEDSDFVYEINTFLPGNHYVVNPNQFFAVTYLKNYE
ncbi:S8 family serine peptidase [Mycoplasma sp. 744]|uniref:S8 family serine peptidase n=1 Tax=Mycoplasma sp. 744 TaxID=3108531 RepID=UPI002B1DBA2D|nr:S8 family serine peptidase [Mycoplasma sp. 744]MEA4115408.1 S8 family serine peptidase [Mycoplasma sp. 744]